MKLNKTTHNDISYTFALRIATAIDDLKSSHAYFIIQKAFGEIDWEEAQEILNTIINHCKCKDCKKIIKEVKNNLKY